MTLLRLKIDLLVAGCLAGVVQLRAHGHKWKEQLKRDSYLGQSVDNGQQVFLQSLLFKTLTRVRNMELAVHRIVVLHGTLGFFCVAAVFCTISYLTVLT